MEDDVTASLHVESADPLAAHPALRGKAVDQPKPGVVDGDLLVTGWVVGEDGPVERVVATAAGRRLARVHLAGDRPDVADVFPDLEHASVSAFRIRLPHPVLAGATELEIAAELADGATIPIWKLTLGPGAERPASPKTRSRRRRRRREAEGPESPPPAVQPHPSLTGEEPRVVAIISAYNEADVIGPVLDHLAGHGIASYLLDNGSTDETASVAGERLGRGLLAIESMPPPQGEGVSWRAILARKEELARELGADWYIHHDADEFREAPLPGTTLRAAIAWVDRMGYNAIDFRVLNFSPVDDAFRPGDDPREHLTRWEPPAEYDRLQRKAWKAGSGDVTLEDGGHDVRFDGRRLFPLRFLLRHYPIRSQAHGSRKVMRERKGRFHADELEMGWHRQYDDVAGPNHLFLRNPASLRSFDLERLRLETLLEDGRAADFEPEPRAAQPEGVQGVLEKVGPDSIFGWAACQGDGEALTVELWDGGRVIAATKADHPRADLDEAGLGAGHGGFAIRTPRELLDGEPHWIWATVRGTPVALRRSPLVLHSVAGTASPAAQPPDPAVVG